MIKRVLQQKIEEKIPTGKAIILLGPRQVGKTTLLKMILKEKRYLFLDGDDPTTRTLLTNPSTEQLKNIIGNHKFVFVDEAQRIENIGITLKLIADQLKTVSLFASGSSAFDLNNQTTEPLTGRKWEYTLFPICWEEFQSHIGFFRSEQQLENRILYGMYPEVIENPGMETEILKQLASSYLYKDILSYGGIRKPDILEKLLRALALQIGNEVNYNELSQLLGIDKKTVSNYIDLLSQAFVVFKLPSFSRNLRNEIKTNQKIYFYDTGIRNTVSGNFNPMQIREDKGALWENFLIAERIKKINYHHPLAKAYFWRTAQQQEIDYVEESSGNICGYEIKWNSKNKVRFPSTFSKTYQADTQVVNRENFRDFIF